MSFRFNGFDWDTGNKDKSLIKHGVSRTDAEEAFLNKAFVFPDTLYSTASEHRFVLFGENRAGKRLFIAFTIRNEKVRVISARPMSLKERDWYEKAKQKTGY